MKGEVLCKRFLKIYEYDCAGVNITLTTGKTSGKQKQLTCNASVAGGDNTHDGWLKAARRPARGCGQGKGKTSPAPQPSPVNIYV